MIARIAIIASFLILGAVGVFLFTQMPAEPNNGGNQVQGSGLPDIGGPFSLTNHLGEPVTDQTYAGKALLIYFGFTYCPDVCPTELSKLSQALDLLPQKTLDKVQPLFVTVDPERDTPEQLALYMSNFHPALVGLTGTAEQLKAAQKAYRIYAAKVDDESSTEGYTYDHSSIIYLMDSGNKYLAHFTLRDTPQDIAKRINALVD